MPVNSKSIDNLHLRSEEVQKIITTPPGWIIRWGITLVSIITCGLVFLTFFIKYPDVIKSRMILSTIVPFERVKTRTHGQIEQLWVTNGEEVNAGQLLASLKSTAKVSDVIFLKRLMEGVPFGKSNGFQFPVDSLVNLALGEIEIAFVEFERSYVEFKLLESLQPSLTQLEGEQRSLEEIHERLNRQMAQKEILDRKVLLVETDFERNRKLFKEGVIAAKDFEDREMEYLQIQEQVNGMAISISQLQEALVQAGQSIKSTQITKEQEETRALINLIQAYNGLKIAVRDWEKTYLLVSSTQGIVSFQGVWSENQFVNGEEHVFSIMPDEPLDLLAKMEISSQNASKISIGQRILIKLDNFPSGQFGIIKGEVGSISVSPDEEGNYLVYGFLPDRALTSYGKEIQLNQELFGTAEIIIEEVSVAERIFLGGRQLLNIKMSK